MLTVPEPTSRMNNADHYRLLLVSSKPPSHSAGLTQTKIDGLLKAGHEVDYLTVYDYDGRPDNVISIFPKLPKKYPSWRRRYVVLPIRGMFKSLGIYEFVKRIKDIVVQKINNLFSPKNSSDIMLLYPDEKTPPISNALLLSKILGKYDAVITLFWEGMLNSTSLKAIYDKLHCPILICAPDMAPMTGGCYYFNKCRNFYTGCGKCIALNSTDENDQTRLNFITKKENYSSINCAFLGNTWMNQYAVKSNLFRHIFHSEVIIDENKFCQRDMSIVRQKLGLLQDKFILLISSSSMPRKGNSDIVDAVTIFYDRLSEAERMKIILLSIGDDYFQSSIEKHNIPIRHLGTVNESNLIYCYQASNLFISASHDDAGPSMINQSIMCGTPVVCYDSGTAIDVIENFVSGYKVPFRDIEGLSVGMDAIFRMSEDEYRDLRHNTRAKAIKHNSTPQHIANIINCIRILRQQQDK